MSEQDDLPTLTVLRGLPASGKSTFARFTVANDPTTKRVSKDDLRAMLDNGVWSRENEAFMNKLREEIIITALIDGYNVIVDDTNIFLRDIVRYREIADFVRNGGQVNFKVKTFDTPLEECLARNAKREGAARVPDQVIRRMAEQWEDLD